MRNTYAEHMLFKILLKKRNEKEEIFKYDNMPNVIPQVGTKEGRMHADLTPTFWVDNKNFSCTTGKPLYHAMKEVKVPKSNNQ